MVSKRHKAKKKSVPKKILRKNAQKKILHAKKRLQTSSLNDDLHRPKIRVVGLGGGGSSIIAEIAPTIKKVDFWAVNTDAQALKRLGRVSHTCIFGETLTNGLGCGSNPRLGQIAAEKAKDKIAKLFDGIDLCILISCLGGGTGSGALSELAREARERGCLSLGIFTLPFKFEGEKKMQAAKQALLKAAPYLSAYVVFPNEKIFKIIDRQTGFHSALSEINAILARDLRNLVDMVYQPGLINIDFADLAAVLQGQNKFAYLASATSSDEQNRTEEALTSLLSHPLNEYDPKGAQCILFNIAANQNLALSEVEEISRAIFTLNPSAKIIFGLSGPSALSTKDKNAITITLLAIGEPMIDMRQKPAAKKSKRKRTAVARIVKKPSVREKETAKPETKPNFIKQRLKNLKKKKMAHALRQIAVIKKESSREENKDGDKLRKNALDLKKEMDLAEQEQLQEEKKWEIPAFLRRKDGNSA